MILFAILRALRRVHPVTLGLMLGIVLGVPAMLMSVYGSQTASVGPAACVIWVLGTFLAWGAVLGRAAQRLIGMEAAPGALRRAKEPAVERIDRRRFLVRLGGSAAVITVAGAVVGELSEARRKELSNAESLARFRSDACPLHKVDVDAEAPEVGQKRLRNMTGDLPEADLCPGITSCLAVTRQES